MSHDMIRNNVGRGPLLPTLVLAYVATLFFAYRNVISPAFSYMGYSFSDPGLMVVGLTWVLATLPSLWMQVSIFRPSQVVYWMLYLIVYIPSVMIPVYSLERPIGDVLGLSFSLFICFILLGQVFRLKLLSIPRLRIGGFLFWAFIGLLSLVSYAAIVKAYGFKINLVSLLDVYDVRADYKQATEGAAALTAYLLHWQSNIINPLLVAYGISKRKILLVVLGVAGQLLIFSITGFKSVLFSSLLILGLVVAVRMGKWRFGYTLMGFSLAGVSSCFLLDYLSGTNLFSSIFVRRMIITPGLLTGYYYDFFSINGFVYLSHSVLKFASTYPYDLLPPNLIGNYYFGKAAASANANVWADAFANFGYVGVYLFTLMLGMVFWLCDSICRGKDELTPVLLLGVPSLALSNSALLTSLLTHGIGLGLLILYLWPEKRKEVE